MAGFFTFKWAHPAGEVYVTGTFDDWQKSTKLEKEGEAFVAKVELPVAKTLYKFVVDGNWVVDQSARREFENGIENNLLIPEDIVAEQMSAATINSAGPDSTTAALAAEVPLEAPVVNTPGPSDVPGGFIETPAYESADPITSEKEQETQEFSVKPLPASNTATNPFTLAPGEPIPVNEFTSQDVNTHVKLDEESYEKADASNLGFGLNGAPVLPEVITPAAQREAEGRGVFDIPTGDNIIPESSLPITSYATTEVPEIVKESQEKAEVEPEASAIPEAVEQKKEVEEELKAEIPAIPEIETTTVAGIMAAAGIASASGEPNEETTPAFVPEIVRESQKEAHVEPEASAVETAVEAKKEYEQELQKEVHEVAPVTLNSAPVYHAIPEPTKPAAEVPEIVQKSQAEAGALPEASGVPETVEQKKVFEKELKTEAAPPTPLPKDEPKEKTETIPSIPPTVPSKTESGFVFVSNGDATEVKTEKTEANGIKSPKKSLENGDERELKKSKRRSFFGSIKDLFFHSGNGTKEKGKAKGDNREGEVMLRNWMVFLAVIVSAFWLFLALLNSMGWGLASVVSV